MLELLDICDYKICDQCHQLKPEYCFSEKQKNPDGLDTVCKKCKLPAPVCKVTRNKKAREYYHRKYREDIQFRLRKRLRNRMSKFLKGKRKSGIGIDYLGCDLAELKSHIESQFVDGMSWDNYGEWHIDHILPLCSADMENEEDLQKVCHYTNLQPLWARDNLVKNRKILSQ